MRNSTHKLLTRQQRLAWWRAVVWCFFTNHWIVLKELAGRRKPDEWPKLKPTITTRSISPCEEMCTQYKDGKGWCDEGDCSLARKEIVGIVAVDGECNVKKIFWPIFVQEKEE